VSGIRDVLHDLVRRLGGVDLARGLDELPLVRVEVREADLEEPLDRDRRPVLGPDHPLVLAPPDRELRLHEGLDLRLELVHEDLELVHRRGVRPLDEATDRGRAFGGVLGQLAFVLVRNPARRHLRHLVVRLGEAAVHGRTQVAEKPRDLALQLRDRSKAPVERCVVPEEVVQDAHPE